MARAGRYDSPDHVHTKDTDFEMRTDLEIAEKRYKEVVGILEVLKEEKDRKVEALNKKYKITGGVGPSDPSINYFNQYFGDESELERSAAGYPYIYFPALINGINYFNDSYRQNSQGKIMLMEKIKRKINETRGTVIINFISHLIGNVRNSNDKHDLLEHIRIN